MISDIVPALAGAGMKRAPRREQEVPADEYCNEAAGIVIAQLPLAAAAGGPRGAPPRPKTSTMSAVAEAIRSIGVSEVTYYRWRQEFGGLKSDRVKRLRDLEAENTRLRRAMSDLTLDKLILQEAARGNY